MPAVLLLIPVPYSLLFTDLKQTSQTVFRITWSECSNWIGIVWVRWCQFFAGALKMNILVIDSCVAAYSMSTKVKYEEPVDHS